MALSFGFGRADNEGSTATTAGVGTAQSGAAALGSSRTNLLTTAVGQTAFVLPSKMATGSFLVATVTTATAALIFPPSGGKRYAGSADASFSVAQSMPVLIFPHAICLDYTVVLSA